MTHDELDALLDYHYWARDRMLDALELLTPEAFTRDLGSSFKSLCDTVVHIYGAELVWYSRWKGSSPTSLVSSSSFPDAPSLRSAWRDLERDVRVFVNELGPDGLNRRFDYKLLSGKTGSSSFWQMVQHVVNHASYHRGQLTTMLRQIGAAPPKSMDLIAFYREREETSAAKVVVRNRG